MTSVDYALLLSGPALLPLIPLGIRKISNKKHRRIIIEQCAEEFNRNNPYLIMKWQLKPEKTLTIWHRDDWVVLLGSNNTTTLPAIR